MTIPSTSILYVDPNGLPTCPIWASIEKKIGMFQLQESREPLSSHCNSRALSFGNASLKLPYLLAYTLDWGVLKNIGSGFYKLCLGHGLTHVTRSPLKWEAFPALRSLTHTKITWASHHGATSLRVTLGPPCAHGVVGTFMERCATYNPLATFMSIINLVFLWRNGWKNGCAYREYLSLP